MSTEQEARQSRISGYLDDALDASERARFEAELAGDATLRPEVESMRRAVHAADALEFEAPPDEVWDGFAESVLSRTERGFGWTMLLLGGVVLIGWSLYHVLFDPWAPGAVRAGMGAVGLGGVALFGSVLRQRLLMRRTDRYSRDVRR